MKGLFETCVHCVITSLNSVYNSKLQVVLLRVSTSTQYNCFTVDVDFLYIKPNCASIELQKKRDIGNYRYQVRFNYFAGR